MQIGGRKIGKNEPTYFIGEIGINHNGDINIAKHLIDVASLAGVDAVKFQKRTVDTVYTMEELDRPRESPWGETNRAQKHGLEFGLDEYKEIDTYTKLKGIDWFASPWDYESVDFLHQFSPVAFKVASPIVTDIELVKYMRMKYVPLIISTGATSADFLKHLVETIGDQNIVLMHCVSEYPCPVENLNLRRIKSLQRMFPGVPIGYSGHEAGLWTTLGAVTLGACVVERHITLDRSMYGSDQSASIEPHGLLNLINNINDLHDALGSGEFVITDGERETMRKLRKVYG
jgi:N-acetylneuraminate synthase